jgi:hypothetical protein
MAWSLSASDTRWNTHFAFQYGAAMRDKGLDPDNDPVTRTDFVRRVTLQLNDLARKDKVEKIGRGRAMRWKLAGA